MTTETAVSHAFAFSDLNKLKNYYRECKERTDTLRAELDIADARERNERNIVSLIKQYFENHFLSDPSILSDAHKQLAKFESEAFSVRCRYEAAHQTQLNAHEQYSETLKQLEAMAKNSVYNAPGGIHVKH